MAYFDVILVLSPNGEESFNSFLSPDPVSRVEFTRIDLAVTSLLANQPIASERTRDQCQRAAVTPSVNPSFSFVSHVTRHLIKFIAIDS